MALFLCPIRQDDGDRVLRKGSDALLLGSIQLIKKICGLLEVGCLHNPTYSES